MAALRLALVLRLALALRPVRLALFRRVLALAVRYLPALRRRSFLEKPGFCLGLANRKDERAAPGGPLEVDQDTVGVAQAEVNLAHAAAPNFAVVMDGAWCMMDGAAVAGRNGNAGYDIRLP